MLIRQMKVGEFVEIIDSKGVVNKIIIIERQGRRIKIGIDFNKEYKIERGIEEIKNEEEKDVDLWSQKNLT